MKGKKGDIRNPPRGLEPHSFNARVKGEIYLYRKKRGKKREGGS